MTKVKRPIQLKSEGISILRISKTLGIHQNTLEDCLLNLKITGKSYHDLLYYNETELAAIIYNSKNTHHLASRYMIFKVGLIPT